MALNESARGLAEARLLQNVFLLTLLARFRVEFSVGGVLFSNCDKELTLAPLIKHLSGRLTFNFTCYYSAEMSPEARFLYLYVWVCICKHLSLI